MDKKYNVILAESFFQDLENIPPITTNEILDKIELLGIFPQLGIKLSIKNWIGYYQLVVKNYRILYTINKEKKLVTVYFARHGKMNFV
ncbi:MAG: type II toxin-antitoxin system RelE/ParE family toxin [bacterium]|nr:type II toxin-antitoxin system RelE/ParE family toxin [bacterium]